MRKRCCQKIGQQLKMKHVNDPSRGRMVSATVSGSPGEHAEPVYQRGCGEAMQRASAGIVTLNTAQPLHAVQGGHSDDESYHGIARKPSHTSGDYGGDEFRVE